MKKLKVLRVTEYGHNLVECPVCKMPYLEHGLNNHLSQMAGKEAQYAMANLYYNRPRYFGLQQPKILTIAPDLIVKEECPHWQYLIENPKVMQDLTPVKQKERYKR